MVSNVQSQQTDQRSQASDGTYTEADNSTRNVHYSQ